MNTRKKLLKRLLITAALTAFLVGTVIPVAMAGQNGKLMVASRPFITKGLDPLTNSGYEGLAYVTLLFDKLVHKDMNAKFVPGIAKSWEFDPDWKYVRFFINQEATFSDGTGVTAADTKFSLDRQMADDSPFIWKAEYLRHINNIVVEDKYTMRVNLKQPFPGFLQRLSMTGFVVPKAYYEKVGQEVFMNNPVGAGPFKFVEYKYGEYVKAVARKDHYRQVPNVKEVEVRYIKDNDTIFAMLQAGELDIGRIMPQQVRVAERDPNMKVLWAEHCTGADVVFIDLSKPDIDSPFHDIRVRQAVAHAINYDAFPKILGKAALVDVNISAPYHPGYDPKLTTPPYPYNPEKAKRLLREAGYPNGFDTELTAGVTESNQASAVKAMLDKVGIRAQLNTLEGGAFIGGVKNLSHKGMVFFLHPFFYSRAHPATALQSTLDKTSIFSFPPAKKYWADRDKLDALTPALILDDEYIKLSKMVTEEDLAKQVRKMTKIYNDTVFRVQIYHTNSPLAVSSRVRNWKPLPGFLDAQALFYEYVTLVD